MQPVQGLFNHQNQNNQPKQVGNYQYHPKRCLGVGQFGTVYEGQDQKTGQKVAIKKIDIKSFQRDIYLQKQTQSEIEIIKKFNHINIVKFIDLIATKNSLYLVTELCSGGDLSKLIASKKLNERSAIKILKHIVEGFKKLVKYGVIHRDLKPANILINEGVFKIADFGFAKYVNYASQQMMRTCVGSPLYMSPQILQRQQYTTKCDIWSLGMIYYEMLFGKPLYNGRDERSLLQNILSHPYKQNHSHLSSFSNEFLRKALEIDERKRMSWDELFNMFFKLQQKEEKLKEEQLYLQKKQQQQQLQQQEIERKRQQQQMENDLKKDEKHVHWEQRASEQSQPTKVQEQPRSSPNLGDPNGKREENVHKYLPKEKEGQSKPDKNPQADQQMNQQSQPVQRPQTQVQDNRPVDMNQPKMRQEQIPRPQTGLDQRPAQKHPDQRHQVDQRPHIQDPRYNPNHNPKDQRPRQEQRPQQPMQEHRHEQKKPYHPAEHRPTQQPPHNPEHRHPQQPPQHPEHKPTQQHPLHPESRPIQQQPHHAEHRPSNPEKRPHYDQRNHPPPHHDQRPGQKHPEQRPPYDQRQPHPHHDQRPVQKHPDQKHQPHSHPNVPKKSDITATFAPNKENFPHMHNQMPHDYHHGMKKPMQQLPGGKHMPPQMQQYPEQQRHHQKPQKQHMMPGQQMHGGYPGGMGMGQGMPQGMPQRMPLGAPQQGMGPQRGYL